jgi:hypothetical protein
MSSSEEDFSETYSNPTYTRGTTPPQDWGPRSAEQTKNAISYISTVQDIRLEIEMERAAADDRARLQISHDHTELLDCFTRADDLVQDRIVGSEYRREWERRWTETAQYWDSGALVHVGERIRLLSERLRKCEAEAAELRELMATTKRELGL